MTLLELAQAELANRSQWYNGETVTIWQSGDRMAWLKNEGGWITLTVFKDAPKLTGRKYSQPLPVGHLDPTCQLWLESENVLVEYPLWAAQTRRQMGV